MQSTIRRCQPHLGTFVEISLAGDRDEADLHALASLAFSEIRRIDATLSFHRADSELSRINRHALRATQSISAAMADVLGEALLLSRESDGLFDVTIAPRLVEIGALPDHRYHADRDAEWRDIELAHDHVRFHRPLTIDLGGIAKGYAVDRAMQFMPDDIEACINAGGDLRMQPWRNAQIAVRLPDSASASVIHVEMHNAALATSIGSLGGHLGAIVHPRSGEVSRDTRSFSVFAASAMRADALTKIACLAPDCATLMQSFGAEILCIDANGCVSELENHAKPWPRTGA